jgi:small subunit ribosomal protein S2
MFKIPELLELLKAGSHFGHKSSKRYPKMAQFVHSVRNQIDIIDLEKTALQLDKACKFVYDLTASGGLILFVASKRQAKNLVREAALDCKMPFVVARWLGGTFTNFESIRALVKKLKELEGKKLSGQLEKYTKKEQLDFEREMARLDELVGGLRDMDRLPSAVFIIDIKKEKTAVAESKSRGVPVIAVVDTNCNPSEVACAIPANDDASKSISLITSVIAEAAKEGRAKFLSSSTAH